MKELHMKPGVAAVAVEQSKTKRSSPAFAIKYLLSQLVPTVACQVNRIFYRNVRVMCRAQVPSKLQILKDLNRIKAGSFADCLIIFGFSDLDFN